MKKNFIFECKHCGAQFQKWIGRCLECGKWGTIEQLTTNNKQLAKTTQQHAPTKTQVLSDMKGKDIKRLDSNISELNRVLGGGLIPGSLILLGGEPGIGKSTLSIQLATIIPESLYISGEESVEQIKLRSDRLKLNSTNLKLANTTNIESIIATIEQEKPKLAIIDSIQTMYSQDVSGESGSPNQVRACTTKLLGAAKKTKTAIVIVGHVTKEGSVAGPKTLEHLVDTVLYLEGDRYHSYRILRTVKNRFGSTDEVGIFEMTEKGLKEVANPSESFLKERGEEMPGSVITCLMEGTRPILVEVQALVNKTSFGYPVRKSSGFDLNRLHVLIAVLQKRAGLNLAQYDVHLNIVGGLKANEPAADLAVCMAVASAFKDKNLSTNLVSFGEVGLGGEVRSVSFLEKRIKECKQLGMNTIITRLKSKKTSSKIKILNVKNIKELINHT
ncbi:MAG: DNA repair protein RadA [Candidatus Magasanikbacteria bacterium]|nr:DNA repair protein RadA [Candidatus Magasanikbacteria bacterium]